MLGAVWMSYMYDVYSYLEIRVRTVILADAGGGVDVIPV